MYSFLKAFLVLMKLLSLSQFYAPRFKTDCSMFLVANCMQIKKRFPLVEGFVASLRILDPASAKAFTKSPISIANVALNFPFVPEDHLEATSTV